MPSKFYICIPEELEDKALEVISKHNYVGLMICSKTVGKKYSRYNIKSPYDLHIVKKAKELHSNNSKEWFEKMKLIIVSRMSSEIATMWNKYK